MGATRLSGLISGMDTDSLVSQLVSAKKLKVTTATRKQTKTEWKQDIWKDLNSQLKKLQSKYISTMRFSSSFTKKATTVSNSNKASVYTGSEAVDGVQSLQIKQLAKTGYLTGSKVETTDGESATALSTMKDLGFSGSGSISIQSGSTQVDLQVSESTTISDVLTKLKEAGLNANFDAGQQRFFVSSKASGAKNDFSITSSDANGQNALEKMGLATNLANDTKTMSQYRKYAAYKGTDDAQTAANMSSVIDAEIAKKTASYLDTYKSAKSSLESTQATIDELSAKSLSTSEEYQTQIDAANEAIKATQESLDGLDASAADYEDRKKELEEQLETQKKNLSSLEENKKSADSLVSATAEKERLTQQIADTEEYITVAGEGDDATAVATDKLKSEVTQSNVDKANRAAETLAEYEAGTLKSTGATKISGQDAVIELNGATFTNDNNVFAINGLTITALDTTAENETISVTTKNDTDGIYDMVKGFLKEYNEIIKKMDTLYYADNNSKYEPLTDEEKEAMSDSEVEKYETKIKDSLLRSDSNLNTLIQTLSGTMSSGFSVGGKTMYLSDFGIATSSYFDAGDNEKKLLHIDGDPDDEKTSGNADKLKSLIASDPDTVVSFFTSLSKDLYDKMSKLSKSVDGTRSYGSFYDDKAMKKERTSIADKISELEDKMNDYEDRMYSKFSKMETAMAKMQSSTSALSGLLG